MEDITPSPRLLPRMSRANGASSSYRYPMSSLSLLVIADPSSTALAAIAHLPKEVTTFVSDNPDELKAQAPVADVVLFAHGNPELLKLVVPLAVRAQWIHSLWTGVEGILTPELREHPAPLTNGRGVFRWPLADWVVAVLLFFAFDLRRVLHQQEQGIWKPVFGKMLEGQTLGIVGYGSIGSAAAERTKPFGMKIAALRRRTELFKADGLVDFSYGPDQLPVMLASCDFVLASTPLTPETRGMIGEAELAAMKPTAVVLNVGRGPVINEPALIRALQNGVIRGAALDVFDTEPLPSEHPFWKMTNVLLSPHTADRVEGFLAPALTCFLENLERFLNGSPLLNLVDKRSGY
jgi:phosphoglycerate dehydrogenase-like enzyme